MLLSGTTFPANSARNDRIIPMKLRIRAPRTNFRDEMKKCLMLAMWALIAGAGGILSCVNLVTGGFAGCLGIY